MMVRVARTLGAAVVGTGFMGRVHVDALRRLGVNVVGMVGSSRHRAAEAGLAPAFESFEAMLGDGRVDVVHITTPNHLHHSQARAALQAGKHVVCEKPLATTSNESADLLATAERSGLVHAVNHNLRFYPLVQHLRAVIEGGELGRIRLISGHYLQDWLMREADWNWRVDRSLGGALRAVGDIGSHWMDMTQFLTGLKITSVMADLARFVETRDSREVRTEDAASILLHFDGGAHGAVVVSQVSPGRKNQLTFEIDGAQSSAAWSSEDPDQLWIGHGDRANQVLPRDPNLLNEPGQAASFVPGGHVEGYADTFRALYSAVYAAIATGRPGAGYPTFADGHDMMLVMDAIARSAGEGRWAHVER
jgi:predicted dehydrogenase